MALWHKQAPWLNHAKYKANNQCYKYLSLFIKIKQHFLREVRVITAMFLIRANVNNDPWLHVSATCYYINVVWCGDMCICALHHKLAVSAF